MRKFQLLQTSFENTMSAIIKSEKFCVSAVEYQPVDFCPNTSPGIIHKKEDFFQGF